MGTFGIIMLVLSAAMSAIGTGLNFYYQDKTNKDQMDFAREQQQQQQAFEQAAAKTANDSSLQMFYQTQSPQAKMEMIKNAGLSPGLIYGGGAATQGSATAAAKASSNAVPMPNIQSPFNADYLNQLSRVMNEMTDSSIERKKTSEETKKTQKEVEQISAKINETEANTKKIEEETKTEVITQNFQTLQNKLAELDLKYQNETFKKRVQTIEEEYNLIKENIRKTGKEIDVMNIEYEWKPKLYENTIKLNNAQIELLGQQKMVAIAQEALTYLQTASEEIKQKLMNEQANEAAEKAYQISVTTKQLEEQLKEIREFGFSATNSNTWIGTLLGTLKKASMLIGDKIQ